MKFSLRIFTNCVKYHKGLFENLIFNFLSRVYGDVYYYKTNNNKEVDFFINKPDGPLLIQASYDFSNHDTQEREITSIVAAISELNLTKGYIYTYNTFDEIFIDEKKNKSFTFLESCFRIRSS